MDPVGCVPGIVVFAVPYLRLSTVDSEGTRVETFDIYNADEAFLSSTAGGIIPIAALDGRTVAAGRRGPITKTITDAYKALVQGASQRTTISRRERQSRA